MSYAMPRGAPVAISPDDTVFLIPNRGGVAIEKFLLAERGASALGPSRGSNPSPVAPDIVFSWDSRTAYVVDTVGGVHAVDVATMTRAQPVIPYEPVNKPASRRIRWTHAALSPDGRFLVINSGRDRISVVNLDIGSSVQVDTPDLQTTLDLAFDHSRSNTVYLAVHGHSAVAVYEFHGPDPLELVVRVIIAPQRAPARNIEWEGERIGTLAWTGAGDGVIAASGGRQEYTVFDFQPSQAPGLVPRLSFDSCQQNRPEYFGQQIDVLTLHGRLTPAPTTPTATLAPSVTSTPADTIAPSPSTTATSLPSPRATASVVASTTPTAPPTAPPTPLYLPVALREHCEPTYQRADIALVVDTSSSMTGLKINDARESALSFVDLIDLEPGRSQVAVVRFDREAEVVHELTNARALIEAAIRNLKVRSGTHIDKGLRVAVVELQSPRHFEHNAHVLILLTDGVQTGTPGEELRAAAEVQDAGVRVYAIGLGADVDEATLRTIAGADERYYFAPDSADLARIYGEIARDLMCPGVDLWGGR